LDGFLKRAEVKFATASMTKKLLHRCIGAHARVHMHLSRHACTGDVERHACADMYVRQML